MDVVSTPSAIGSIHAREPRLVFAHVSDHAAIHALLRAANQSPSYDDFLTSLDEPSYEPSDRLLLRYGQQIVAHAQLLERMAWFGGVKIAVGSVQDLAILPEYAQAGYEVKLLATAEQQMHESQAIISLTRSDRPEPFRAAGWTDVRGQGHSEVAIGDLLAHLSAQSAIASRRWQSPQIRRWRHVELDAVRAVYAESASRGWGAVHRGETYWQWLVGRKAHSDVIVAVEGADQWQDAEKQSRIVGYAVTCGDKILELCCLADFARAAPRLVVRACQEAIEHDHHTLSLYAPASDPLHELVVTAGGSWCADERSAGGTLLVKLLSPPRWVQAIYPILRRRAKRAGLPRPFQICFDCGSKRHQLVVTRRSSRLVEDTSNAADVQCDAATFESLLVGNLSVSKAIESGRLHAATEEMLERVNALFPPALFWQSRFDMLRF
ncbi:MAG TPA: GNAT family N-acetyltransferase [Lacipirellulaceae bacterium]